MRAIGWITGRPSTRPSHTSPGVRSQMAIAQSAPTCRRPPASTACNRRRTSSTPAPKRESTSGSRLMSRNSITPARAARTSRRCCHSMPALQTGHLVLYQTVSVELIPDLVVLEPQRLERFDNHKNLGCPQGLIHTFGARTQLDMAEPCAYFAE